MKEQVEKAPGQQPNIVLILTDDQGYGDIHSHGNDEIDTPVLDRFAEQGVRFDRFFVSPLCSPTRAALLTGRYHPRTGVLKPMGNLETMRSEEVTIAEALKEHGYATGCFGKWHNGAYYPNTAQGQGFGEFFGFRGGFFSNYFDPELEWNECLVQTKGYITDILAEKAINFIEKHCNRPFFCYVPFNAPHAPMQCPDELFDKYKQRGFDDYDACIYAMCENIDMNVGKILNKLDELSLTENTIVVFMTDNGPNGDRYNDGMRGKKGSVHEGGNRVPLFIRWPRHIEPGSVIERIAAHIDVFPTLMELCGLPMPETLPLDGMSLVPLLCNQHQDWPERMILIPKYEVVHDVLHSHPGAVRTDRYRLVVYPDRDELYDMLTDPGETKDMRHIFPDIAVQMRKAYDTWFEEMAPEGGRIERLPIPVGYDEAGTVELPAPYCCFHGEVGFAGRGWELDWITGWKSKDDYVYWNIDVVSTGQYEVAVHYTCPSGNTGIVLRAEAGTQFVDAIIDQAHDPVEILRPDRVPRKEQNEREWADLTLGTIELYKGRIPFYIKVLEIPGTAAMDLSSVYLKRIGRHQSD
jgi:arylsulfatase A